MPALSDRHHGVTSIESTEGVRAIDEIASNIIGVIVTGEDSDDKTFPMDTPIFSTSARALASKAGDKGTIGSVLDGITDQADSPIIVVRVPASDTEAEQTASVIGTNTNGRLTGLKALAAASQFVGFDPKIIGAPALDSQGVAAELATVADLTMGFAYAKAHGESLTELAAYRDNFGQRELMLIDNEFTRISEITGTAEAAKTIAIALGLRSKIDQQIGWHKTLSNVVVNGVTGIQTPRTFSLTNKNTDANFLNNNEITTLIRQEGFRFWGNRTCASDPMFAFESSVRTAQIIRQTIAEAQLWAIDRPMLPALIADVLLSINNKLAKYVRQGRLLGARVFIQSEDNLPSDIMNGQVQIGYEFTAVPPLENLVIEQRVTSTFAVNLVNRMVEFASQIRPVTV